MVGVVGPFCPSKEARDVRDDVSSRLRLEFDAERKREQKTAAP